MSGGFPWRDWLSIAVVRFGLPPETFWSLSLNEWRMLLEGESGGGLGRAGLDALMASFPDRPSSDTELPQ